MASATKPIASIKALERRDGESSGGSGPFLCSHLPGLACALPLAALREVVPMALLSRPPGRPALLEGLLNLGGSAVPVVRLDRLFGLPELVVGLYSPLLVLRQSEDHVAFLVEAINGVLRVSADEVRPVRETLAFNDCIEGEITAGETIVYLLAPDRLLLEKERQFLAELQAAEQDRLHAIEESSS